MKKQNYSAQILLLIVVSFLTACSEELTVEEIEESTVDICLSQPVDSTFCNCLEWNSLNTPHSDIDSLESSFLHDYLNPYRIENQLNELSIDGHLSVAAQRHANDMANRDYFSHDTEGCAFTPSDRALFSDAVWDAENIAVGQRSSAIVFEAWRNSEGHNRNMLAQHTVIGIGLAYNERGVPYWVNMFK